MQVAEEVRLDNAPVRLWRNLLEPADRRQNGVVDSNVDAAEMLDGPPREFLFRPEVRHIR